MDRSIRKRLTGAAAGLLALSLSLLGVTPAFAHTATAPAGEVASTTTTGTANSGVLGDYNSVIRESTPRADGIRHVDTPATIAKLQDLNVNTFAFLIWHEDTDWDDLVNEFMPAAESAGINVWGYIVPPDEGSSEPYGHDYVAWGEAFADLSLTYSNFTAWVIDDFASNLSSTFTTTYMSSITTAVDAINPDLDFFPILYKRDYTPTIISAYSSYIDGAIFPYNNYPAYDTSFTDTLEQQLDDVSGILKPLGKRVYLMPYAAPLSLAPFPPSGAYIAAVNEIGLDYMDLGKIDGVVNYATAKQPVAETCQAGIDHLQVLRLPWETPTAGGDYVAISQTVPVTAASQYIISFWERDSYAIVWAPNDIYLRKQVLVDGVPVTDHAPSEPETGAFNKNVIDVTSLVAGKSSVTITFRLYNPVGVSNWGLMYMLSDLQATGFAVSDFTDASAWTTTSTSPAFTSVQLDYDCDPLRQQAVFDAISDAFGAY